MAQLNAQDLIETLGLEPHVEGGYFKKTFQANHRERIASPYGPRFQMTSIFYLLTRESPVGHWHRNRSDIVHYFHLGDAIEYHLIYPEGRLESLKLGSNILAAERLQFTALGQVWKCSHTLGGSHGFSLISEAVAPGWDAADMNLGTRENLLDPYPQHREIIEAFLSTQ